ncbi:MAG: maltokinase N-terminal cap-like domain-containing protein [Dermatophilaceae bacterium]
MQALESFLPSWIAKQRWYAGKGRVPMLRRIGGLRLQDPAGEVDIDVHLLMDESGQSPTIYQVPLTYRSARLAGADHALVATVEQSSHGRNDHHGTRYVYDAPHDPVFATALLQLMLGEGTAASDEASAAVARGHRVTTAIPGQPIASHVLKGEQSNTSIILDLVDTLGTASNPLICKLFRVLHHGDNPDVEVQGALAAEGSTRVPRSVGHIVGEWPDPSAPDGMARGHLAFAQEFFPGVEDAWRVALAAVASDADFSERARSLGQITAEVHASLAQAMTTVAATNDDVAALTRSMRARHASAVSEVPALAAYDSMVHASIARVPTAKWPALQRIHGDYHLGQVLDVPHRGWVLVDFEGEPLRPLAERTQPDLALRDVAGMLRSFDYAAGSWEQTHPGRSAAEWADRARIAFLEGYAKESGRDPREDAVLLDALELDKALYEVVYEARNRPTWLTIPTTAIDRLFAGRRSDLRL